jgi:hypothetical protein
MIAGAWKRQQLQPVPQQVFPGRHEVPCGQ